MGTWNIRTFTGKEVEIIEGIEKYRLDILGLSEVWKKGSGKLHLDKRYHMIYSGVASTNRAKEGVSLILSDSIYNKVEGWDPVNPRIITANISLKIGKVTLRKIYTPTEDADALDKELFYINLERVVERYRSQSRNILIMGDLNARIGNDFRRAQGVMGLLVKFYRQ